ncbi:head GIN domain-containing protein [Mucilaginibacter sp. PAMB04168]|uniref:head GIN domain-containing protein n=1 Tax=Mucilaginibacter sp. PAMB04168 TaxID=3138567 RepID=UPI0031F62E11
MKNRISILLLLVAVTSLSVMSSCHLGCIKGSGKQVSENRNISKFSKLEISGGFKINLKQDSSYTLSVTADENLMKYIRTEVSGNKLKLYTRKNFCSESPIMLNVGIGQLEEIKGSGAVELVSEGRINAQNFKMSFSGASKIDMDLSVADLQTEASGATQINLKGQAASHTLKVSGVGKLHAFDFVVGNYNIKTSGSGNCEINVLKSLITHTSGVANIQYKGNPSNVETHKSGASSIKKVQ